MARGLLKILVLVALLGIVHWLGRPSQPEGYKRYMCQEAHRGALNACELEIGDLPEKEARAVSCHRIAGEARHLCEGSMPEEHAEP